MVKPNIFEISFTNLNGVYYPGHMVDGYVTVELTEPMRIKGIRLSCEGKAYLSWSRKDAPDESATEKYFNHNTVLCGKISDEPADLMELPFGRHTFPFQFQLPEGLPSSFEGSTGYVRYEIDCEIVKPEIFNHTTSRRFTVVTVLDLNTQPQYAEPASGNNEKNFCCLWCKSGPISAQFRIDRQCFVPGEAIKLYADINNGSNRTIDKTFVSLIMTSTFYASPVTKSHLVREVARVSRPGFGPFGEDHWNGEELVVPPLPPSFLTGCNIINIEYSLQLSVDPKGPSLDLEVPLTVVIGTIPLASVVKVNPPMPPADTDKSDKSTASTEPLYPPVPGIPNLPPPSYNQCITSGPGGAGGNASGNENFAPVYAYYNWGHTPAALPEPSSKT